MSDKQTTIPADIAETLDDALITWRMVTLDAQANYGQSYKSEMARIEAAFQWLKEQTKGNNNE
jgi:hypothetical protein